MIQFIIEIILLLLAIYLLVMGATFITTVMSFAYWLLSILMTPVFLLIMIIGAIVGLVCSVRNAIKALKDFSEGVN